MKKKKFSIVIATDDKNGIGKNGTLAWRIKEDMDFFRTLTTSTKKSHRQNAVIMGRKTWESIPEKFRPLSGRVNCVLSSSYTQNPTIINSTTFGFSDFEDCHIFLSKRVDIENIFIIGGSYLYNLVLDTPCLENIYITRVYGDFACDTFFSPIPQKFSIVQTGEKKTIDGVSYQMFVYKNNERKHFLLSQISRKNVIFSASILGVVLLLFIVSFFFNSNNTQTAPIPATQESPILEIPINNPTKIPDSSINQDSLDIEVILPQEETQQEEKIVDTVKGKEDVILGLGYSITYPLETSIDDEIKNYIEEKKLEYKIKNFNAKNAGNELNWEIKYELTESEIIFIESRSGEKISETKIPLN